MRLAPLALVALSATIAACGGSSGSGDSTKSGAEIFDCLNAQAGSAKVSDQKDDLDLLAQAAGDRGIAVNWDKNELNLAVERSEQDAKQTLKGYEIFIADAGHRQLERMGNVVVAFSKTPNDEELALVDACL
jgi:hypothetical protein